MSLKYEPFSELLHISAKKSILRNVPLCIVLVPLGTVLKTVTAGNTDDWGIYTLSLRTDQVLYSTVLLYSAVLNCTNLY